MADAALQVVCISSKRDLLPIVGDALKPAFPRVKIQHATTEAALLESRPPQLIIMDAREATEKLQPLDGIPTLFIVKRVPRTPTTEADEAHIIAEHCHLEEVCAPYFGSLVRQLLARGRLSQALAEAQSALRERSIRDELTGLYNRSSFLELFSQTVKKAQRYKRPISLLLIDLDRAREFAVEHGHASGDQVLKEVATLIQHTIREVDLAARFVNDLYAIALPETALDEARVLAERLRKTLRYDPAQPSAVPLPTASIGLSGITITRRSAEELIELAEKALLAAKQAGGDQLVVWDGAKGPNANEWKDSEQRSHKLRMAIAALTLEARQEYFERLGKVFAANPSYAKHALPHAERVAFYADRLASKLGWKDGDRQILRRGALLHDIGLSIFSDRMLGKQAALDPGELDMIRQHPIVGVQLLDGTSFVGGELPIILHHHERFDGSGYPDHLMGSHIPMGARIVGIVEAWDRMVEPQPYRPAKPLEAAIAELKAGANTQFDPQLTATFVQLIAG